MKTLIAYCTETGNTKMLAEEIATTLNNDCTLKTMAEVEATDNYDCIYVGFPFNSFAPTEEAQEFIQSLPQGQKVVLFATHAVPTESTMNVKQKEKALKCASHLNVTAFFTCRGELSIPITEMLLKSDNAEMQYFGKMRPETIGHPDQKELGELKQLVKKLKN